METKGINKESNTIESLMKKVNYIKMLLPCEQFVLTGSLSFCLYGLIPVSEVGDLDIILVNPTEESVNIMKRLQKEFPALTKFHSEKMGVIFMQDEVKVDIFIVNEKVHSIIKTDSGVELTPINRTVDAKKSYNRIKDWLQLRKLSRLFFKEEDFQTFLNK